MVGKNQYDTCLWLFFFMVFEMCLRSLRAGLLLYYVSIKMFEFNKLPQTSQDCNDNNSNSYSNSSRSSKQKKEYVGFCSTYFLPPKMAQKAHCSLSALLIPVDSLSPSSRWYA